MCIFAPKTVVADPPAYVLLPPPPPPEEFGAVLHTVTASDIIGAYMGESERRLREVFEAARADAKAGRVVVVFLDEVRGGRGGGERGRGIKRSRGLVGGDEEGVNRHMRASMDCIAHVTHHWLCFGEHYFFPRSMHSAPGVTALGSTRHVLWPSC